MKYVALVALLAAFVLQVWFIYWKNANEPQVSRVPKHPLFTEGGTEVGYMVSPERRARASSNPDLGDNVIRGTVINQAGQPVSGAEVEIEKRRLDEEPRLRSARNEGHWIGSTDGAGAFSFATLPAGQFVVAARTGEEAALSTVTLSENDAQELSLKLAAALPLQGQVQTPTGQPVGNTLVYPLRSSISPKDELYRLYPARTNPKGQFDFGLLPRATWDFLVISKDHTPTLVRQVQHDGAPVTLALKPGASLSGRVLSTEEAKGIGGLPLVLVEKEFGLERINTRTNPAGVFDAANLRPAEYTVELNSTRWALREPAAAATGATPDSFVVTVEKTGSLRGRVVSESDAEWGIAGAVVRAEPREGGKPAEVRTDARGGYFFSSLKAGEYTLRLMASGVLAPTQSETHPVTVESGKRLEGPVLTAKTGAEVAGEVVDTDAKPVAGATVHLQTEGGELRSARSDQYGMFKLSGLRHEEIVSIWAEQQGMQSTVEGPAEAVALAAQKLRLQLELPNTARVTGRVVNAQGSGLANIPVVCSPTGGVRIQELQVSTGPDGSFSFDNLPPAEYRLRVAQSGPYADIAVPVTLQEGMQAEDVEMVLP